MLRKRLVNTLFMVLLAGIIIFPVATTRAASSNLIANPSLVTTDPSNPALPQNWSQGNWGSNSASFNWQPGTGTGSSGSLTVQLTNYQNGDAKWYFTSVTVHADTQYKFTDEYKSNVSSQVEAVFSMSDGSTNYQIIGLPSANNNWTRFSSAFVVPLGAQSVDIYHLIASNGYLTTSNYSLTTYTPSGFNDALVTITFDNGYASTFNYALPLLQQDKFVSTQFIISGVINTPGFMTIQQLKAAFQSGNEIASHTVTHNDLSQESRSQLNDELAQSQNQLSRWIGAPVDDLAYPFGLYNNMVLNATANYYGAARGVEDGLNSQDNLNIYDIKTQNVFYNTSTAQIADWVYQAQQTKTWLVLVYHSVDPNLNPPADGNIYNVTPAQLSDQLNAIKNSGVKVVTMKQAIKRFYHTSLH